MYPIEYSVDFTIPDTPSFPAAARPVGHGTDFPLPICSCHVGLVTDR